MLLQIGVYRPGALPLDPTKGTFEKVPLESSKLSKRAIYQYFLKVLEKGSGEKLLSRSFSPAFSSFSPINCNFLVS